MIDHWHRLELSAIQLKTQLFVARISDSTHTSLVQSAAWKTDMPLKMKSLCPSAIGRSNEIGDWLSQFPAERRKAALSLLARLQFVSRDAYSDWLLEKLGYFAANGKCAVYSVRKIEDQDWLWDDHGEVVGRSGASQGSEDFVYSLIANATRAHEDTMLDHPSLHVLRHEQIRDVVLLDDSIGTGNRVARFVRLMMANGTFKSWWSLGLIKLHIVSLARTHESECVILEAIPGSDHWRRKYRKSSKIVFLSDIVYGMFWLRRRWGPRYQDIIDLCNSLTAIPKDRRQGYGSVMSNIVFCHSVPNNTPGVIWCKRRNWKPLFPRRAVPDWLPALLNSCEQLTAEVGQTTDITRRGIAALPAGMLELLSLIKLGVRKTSSLALRMDLDVEFTKSILQNAILAGFVSGNGRITEAGIVALKRQNAGVARTWDRSLYIPQSWCSDQASIQPLVFAEQADPVEACAPAGGDAGQVSLERTDATTTPSSSIVKPQAPSKSRKGLDYDGPMGQRER